MTGKEKFALFPSSEVGFFVKDGPTRLTFVRPKEGEGAPAVFFHDNRNDATALRKQRPVLTPEQMQEYTGSFYSAELGVLYTVIVRDGGLLMRYPRGEMPLETTLPDAFAAPDRYPVRTIQYTRNTDKTVTGFVINTSRVRNLRFVKAAITPAPGQEK
jgi:hypothetical protein